jgi:2-polyprenyl-3-methyl-5-hydroxy-6-metoxy-1,4-benzoquinol methylase
VSDSRTTIRADVEALVERVKRCPLCGSSVADAYGCRDRLLGVPGEFRFGKCDACGAGILIVRPTERSLARYYPEDYGPYSHRSKRAQRSLVGRIARRIQLLVPALLPDAAVKLEEELRHGDGHRRGCRILDVGCADGRHLARDVAAGWDATGVDFSPIAVERARSRGLDVRLGTIFRHDLGRESFDLVRMSHVIEHVPDPIALLRRGRDLLVPGGRLHISTPNFASPSASFFGTYWVELDAPRHLILFTPGSLRAAAHSVRLVVEKERHEVVPSDFWASLAYWLTERRGRRPVDYGSLKTRLGLRTSLYPLWWLLAQAGRGERMHMIFRRPG